MPSSVIRYYHYYPDEQRLRVTYLSGAVYDYLGVPAGVYAAMKAYQSKGTFLNREIKGHYPFQKISAGHDD
jgi:KTSC domain